MSTLGSRSGRRFSHTHIPITPIADNKNYLVSQDCKRLAEIRLDYEASISSMPYGQTRTVDGVKISFHPAGHILGSAQVRVEYKGEVWVVSGDFKLTPDPTCAPFEPVKCNYFITEATFGLPIYRWGPPEQVFDDINEWWRRNREREKASVIFAYSLGKAQRVIAGVDNSIGPIYTHGAVERLNQAYRETGVDLPPTIYAGSVTNKKEFIGSLIVAPPSAQATTWLRRFGSHSTAFASGWMMVRGARRQARRRSRICNERPRRLARAKHSHPRNRCRHRLRDARLYP